jgi:hypothetical protein
LPVLSIPKLFKPKSKSLQRPKPWLNIHTATTSAIFLYRTSSSQESALSKQTLTKHQKRPNSNPPSLSKALHLTTPPRKPQSDQARISNRQSRRQFLTVSQLRRLVAASRTSTQNNTNDACALITIGIILVISLCLVLATVVAAKNEPQAVAPILQLTDEQL